jgi:diadenosine tetraphosphate (Ap4A) HIT family hydrolase
LESQSFVFLRDISPIVPGHSLLIPKRHLSNFGQLAQKEREEFVAFKKDCVAFITRRFAAPMLFEHGSRNGEISHGACVAHAHIHLIPVQAPVCTWIMEAGNAEKYSIVFPSDALTAAAEDGYLAHEDQSG